MALLAEIEAYYDTVPRVAATTEECGPFTVFVARPENGWQFYARPRLGLDEAIAEDDVRRLLARQGELGVPQSLEWVHETTPTLLPTVRKALGDDIAVERCPLQVLGPELRVDARNAEGSHRTVAGDDPDLPLVVGAVRAAFGGQDDVTPATLGPHRELISSGQAIVVAAYDAEGRIVGGGTAAPRGTVSELMGIAVVPAARRRGHGAAITAALVAAARAVGVRTLFLSAGTPAAAELYAGLGFTEIGTACILELDS